MPDLIAIAQGLNAIRSASQIAQAMIGLRDEARILEHSVDLNRKIADALAALNAAHTEQAALLESVDKLKKEVTRLKAWNADQKRYQLEQLPPGVNVYTLKQSAAKPGEPIHSICPTCYGKGEKQILQRGETNHGQYELKCHSCPTTLTVGHFNPPPPQPIRYRNQGIV